MSLRIGWAPTLSKSWQVLAHFGGMLNLFMISIVDITHCHIPYINITWAVADICKIYCPSLLRGILWMPNIFHLNRWKLQRRDGVSIRVEMERKAQEEKDDGGSCMCVSIFYACLHVCAGQIRNTWVNRGGPVESLKRPVARVGAACLLAIATYRVLSARIGNKQLRFFSTFCFKLVEIFISGSWYSSSYATRHIGVSLCAFLPAFSLFSTVVSQ